MVIDGEDSKGHGPSIWPSIALLVRKIRTQEGLYHTLHTHVFTSSYLGRNRTTEHEKKKRESTRQHLKKSFVKYYIVRHTLYNEIVNVFIHFAKAKFWVTLIYPFVYVQYPAAFTFNIYLPLRDCFLLRCNWHCRAAIQRAAIIYLQDSS